jgi:hypothetical protein
VWCGCHDEGVLHVVWVGCQGVGRGGSQVAPLQQLPQNGCTVLNVRVPVGWQVQGGRQMGPERTLVLGRNAVKLLACSPKHFPIPICTHTHT